MNRTSTALVTAIAVVIVIAALLALSWGVAAFLTWLLSMCFGFVWTARVSTGVWLLLLVVSALVAVRND